MQSERRLLEARIERLLAVVPKIEDEELRAELTKHLCVLSSGLLEVGCRDILNRYTSRRSSPQVQRFVAARLNEFQMPKSATWLNCCNALIGSATKWRASLSDEDADSIDSIVNNRHQIAHGRSVGLSFDVFTRYHEHAAQALLLMEKAFPSH